MSPTHCTVAQDDAAHPGNPQDGGIPEKVGENCARLKKLIGLKIFIKILIQQDFNHICRQTSYVYKKAMIFIEISIKFT